MSQVITSVTPAPEPYLVQKYVIRRETTPGCAPGDEVDIVSKFRGQIAYPLAQLSFSLLCAIWSILRWKWWTDPFRIFGLSCV